MQRESWRWGGRGWREAAETSDGVEGETDGLCAVTTSSRGGKAPIGWRGDPGRQSGSGLQGGPTKGQAGCVSTCRCRRRGCLKRRHVFLGTSTYIYIHQHTCTPSRHASCAVASPQRLRALARRVRVRLQYVSSMVETCLSYPHFPTACQRQSDK